MSRRWIQNPNRCTDEYLDGIEDFIEFACRHNPSATRIRCRRCNNTLWETIENVGCHLVRNGMIETYNIQNLHGEQLDNASSSNATMVDNVEPIVDPNEQVIDIINEAFPFASTNINQEREDDVPTLMDSAEFEQYEQLLKNANQELYSEYETLDTYPICKKSRFKTTSQNRTTKIPKKVMRYLPLKPRLHRLYMSTHTATDMRWRKEKRVDDDVMRHPVDGEAWKEFDLTFSDGEGVMCLICAHPHPSSKRPFGSSLASES
ncbi:hypothetical protein Prudu_021235 [Prunus dulcis]|uniref:Transposase-associated domain-containing protein n=1 Tax=Prunus dulcis TaxID=3755 RepID=A0A4Y1RX11_PRUDU|nr:hypothetical protein Prudu_021235 [Prunus dulcis]